MTILFQRQPPNSPGPLKKENTDPMAAQFMSGYIWNTLLEAHQAKAASACMGSLQHNTSQTEEAMVPPEVHVRDVAGHSQIPIRCVERGYGDYGDLEANLRARMSALAERLPDAHMIRPIYYH